MDKYKETLAKIGLTNKEGAVYIALLELGQADVTDIASKAGIKRPTAYTVLYDLEKRGLVSSVSEGKIKRYVATEPSTLLALEKAKIAELESALPGLIGLASQSDYKPSARFFTGPAGIRAVYEESLLQSNGSEMLALGNAQVVEEYLPGFGEWYIKRRVNNGIRMRAITPATPGGAAVATRDKDELRHTRLLDADKFTEPVEINIYGNKLSAVSLIENELVGIIIESKVLASAQKQIFEILWNTAKEQIS